LRAALVTEGLAVLDGEEHADVSLRELARRLDVSPNAAYRHFAGKDALLSAMAAEGFRRLAEAAIASQTAPGDAAARLRAYGRSYVQFARTNPALFRLMFGTFTASERSDELSEAGTFTFRALRAAVADVAGCSPEDERAIAGTHHAWSLVHGLSHLILDGQIEGDPDAVTDAVLNMSSALGGRR
jgi:AcrR family transcriptional regulator